MSQSAPKKRGRKDPGREAAAAASVQSRDRQLSVKNRARVEARDIGSLPEVVDPERRERGVANFRDFCESYFPETFTLGWSPDHLKVIAAVERSVIEGGLFAMAMPRGSGKTSLVETACVWALVAGHRDFVCLIGSDEAAAEQMLDSIKTELETNDRLNDDFPEACYPIRKLDGIPHRAGGQLYTDPETGEQARTHIGWTAKEIILPTIPGSRASGGIIMVRGITGRIRGMKFKRPDGKSVRPSLVVIDDPQTDESAHSPSQCSTREAVLSGAILGLAGPGKKISGIMPCTVIRPDDMADRILNRDLHPEWNGTRCRLMYAFPTAEKLWEEYGRIRSDGMRQGDGGAAATAFYVERRTEMDAGAEPAWLERHNPDEASAIQHVMNLKLQDPAAFAAEYQNDPIPNDVGGSKDMKSDQIAARVNGIPHQVAPSDSQTITCMIDVQGDALFYVICAWSPGFTGAVIDYGAYPDPQREYFVLREMKRTLSTEASGAGLEGAIMAGLTALVGDLMGRQWTREDGTTAGIDRLIIDANWGASTETVYAFCQRSTWRSVLTPSHGKFIGASGRPMAEWTIKKGDRLGYHWMIPASAGRGVRHLLIDVNHWKSYLFERLNTHIGDPGALTFYGDEPRRHRLISEHLTSEYRIPVEGRGRKLDEWKHRPENFDNHWLDCIIGCMVGASMMGISLGHGHGDSVKPAGNKRKRQYGAIGKL